MEADNVKVTCGASPEGLPVISSKTDSDMCGVVLYGARSCEQAERNFFRKVNKFWSKVTTAQYPTQGMDLHKLWWLGVFVKNRSPTLASRPVSDTAPASSGYHCH
ncbi:hypothetical protein INR49_000575, partial [Caranx melampygus]